MVAIPNHHFFQWVNQLKDSGYEVYWFDVTDGGPKSPKIKWVRQIKGWKLKWDFPLRTFVKKRMPKLYAFISNYNQNNTSIVFEKKIKDIKPDVVHCFEMQLSGLPILSVMENNSIPLIYSSWGSDVFYFKELGVSNENLQKFYNRVNYLITDCKRDYNIAVKNGYKNKYLGVFPGNGGISVESNKIKPISDRSIVLIKGYDDGVGKASIVLDALETIDDEVFKEKSIVVYSADTSVETQVKSSNKLSRLNIKIYSRYKFVPNTSLLQIMGKSYIHIGNSVSDGMPNALLEAMAMGAFPIQSNPGNVTTEVITNNKNGFIINNPLDKYEIAQHIKNALLDINLLTYAKDFNVEYMEKEYNRATLQPKIEAIYKKVLT